MKKVIHIRKIVGNVRIKLTEDMAWILLKGMDYKILVFLSICVLPTIAMDLINIY